MSIQLFPGYTDADTAIFAEFRNPDAKPEPGFIVDFLGTRIRTTSLWKYARTLDGQLLGFPIPSDFHAETVEWLGLLKAVRGASGQYVAMELGAGFGPWVIAGAVAARGRGIKNIRLCAVEGDSTHFQFLRQHFTDNGFEPDRHALFEAAVGTKAGVAQWPIVEDSSEACGSRLIQDASDHEGGRLQNARPIDVVPLFDLVVREPRWDLIHIDVQGDEVDICRSCIDELSARVSWIVVGTHSRKIDGDFLDLMWRAGWLLEHEKPSRFTFDPGCATLEAMTTIDGTQVWRNPRLMPEGGRLSSFSQRITCPIDGFRLHAGSTYILDVVARNTGTQPWVGGGQALTVAASYRWVDSEGVVLPIEGKRTQLGRRAVQPDESDPLKLQVVAPPIQGSYTLWVSMVQEGVNWFFERGAEPLILGVVVD